MKTVKVSGKGQISIPKDIRISIGIDKGDELVIVQSGDKIMIIKGSKIAEGLVDDFSDMEIYAEESLKDIWDNDEDEVWNKL